MLPLLIAVASLSFPSSFGTTSSTSSSWLRPVLRPSPLELDMSTDSPGPRLRDVPAQESPEIVADLDDCSQESPSPTWMMISVDAMPCAQRQLAPGPAALGVLT